MLVDDHCLLGCSFLGVEIPINNSTTPVASGKQNMSSPISLDIGGVNIIFL